jgi:L-malate glycosyltransferase
LQRGSSFSFSFKTGKTFGRVSLRSTPFFVLLIRMKILQISSAPNYGGGERHVVDLSRGLAARGHDVFAAVRPPAGWHGELSFLPPPNIIRLPLRYALDIASSVRLSRIIRRQNIDIVHAHIGRDYAIASLAVRLAPSAKLVLTRHVLFPFRWQQKRALRHVARIIAVSSSVRKQLAPVFPDPALIHNGIDIEKWARADRDELKTNFRADHDVQTDAFLIGTVGELKLLKGQEDFVIAAATIAEKLPDAHFVIVGTENSRGQSFRRELKRLAKVLGIEHKIIWLDRVENTVEIFHALDVFVSPSHSESFGLAIVEAAAAACPIAATATDGALEILEDGKSGKLVPVKEPLKLAEAVIELAKNDAARASLGSAARQRVREHFSLERMVAETEAVYKEILAGSRIEE